MEDLRVAIEGERPRYLTVGELKAWLGTVPEHWRCWGYEGEATGVTVSEPDGDGYAFAYTPGSFGDVRTAEEDAAMDVHALESLRDSNQATIGFSIGLQEGLSVTTMIVAGLLELVLDEPVTVPRTALYDVTARNSGGRIDVFIRDIETEFIASARATVKQKP